MKRCICHLAKWQIHPFMSKGTNCGRPLNCCAKPKDSNYSLTSKQLLPFAFSVNITSAVFPLIINTLLLLFQITRFINFSSFSWMEKYFSAFSQISWDTDNFPGMFLRLGSIRAAASAAAREHHALTLPSILYQCRYTHGTTLGQCLLIA